MKVLEVKNISKHFDDIKAISNITFDVNKSEMYALVGPDGAGKSTLIRMICGIIKPNNGELNLWGMDYKNNKSKIVKKLGYLSQKFSLYGDLTIDENIQYFAEIHDVRDFKKRRDELLEFTRLTNFRNRLASKLSGGMKQKLALSCTLIHNPELLLLDEPTTGVDPVSRRDFWKILSEILHTGITIILTTPYLDEAERCHKVGMLNKGEFLKIDTPNNFKKSLDYNLMEIITSDIQKSFSIIKQSNFVKEAQIFGDRIDIGIENDTYFMNLKNELIKNEIEIQSSRKIKPSLENIFISLLSKKNEDTK